VLLLRFVADLPHREIARMLHRRTSAVKALQRRGLDRLAQLLTDE
jgi:RNA polymerase sigma-70 factor (ECF subfamily)